MSVCIFHSAGSVCVTLRWGGVCVFGTVCSGGDAAGGGGGRGLEELLFHVGLFDKRAGRPQQHDAVQHLQGNHPTHIQCTHVSILSPNPKQNTSIANF